MRAWDTWNSYLDNDGNLLHGKIRFCLKDTTTDVAIYNSDGDPIRNPEFTDMLGRTEYQVFLDNPDNVTAHFYKYVGTGDMTTWPIEDYDPLRWAYQYSSDSMDPVSKIDIEANTASGVGTMTAFRDVDPTEVPEVGGKKFMWLYGYYAAGDTSPVLYVWDSASQATDDAGAVIQANAVPGAGRWLLCTRELHFDVRHFGVFPTDDIYSTDYQYTSQLANCANYLDREGLDAWFPALNDSLSYYLYNGTNTFAIKGDIYVSDNVRMHCKTGTTGTIITCNRLYKESPYLFVSTGGAQTGTATLNADWINISWVGAIVTGNARIGWIIDSNSATRTITGKEVVFETNGSGYLVLDNCQITSHKKISGKITIRNGILKTEWFTDNYNWGNLTATNNKIYLANCKDADTYFTLKNKQVETDYGDMGGKTVTNGQVLSGGEVSNCRGSLVCLGNALLRDCDVSVTVNGSTPTFTLYDSKVNFQTVTLGTLVVYGGELSGTKITVTGSRCEIHDCNVNIPMDFRCPTFVYDSSLQKAMTHVGNPIVEVFKNCIFNAQLTISGSAANSVVNYAVWVDNYGSVSNPIKFDRTNLASTDLSHTYKYEGNSGTFPSNKVYEYQSYITESSSVGDSLFATGIPKGEPMPWLFFAYTAEGTVTHMPNITLFRVGTDDIPLYVRWRVVSATYNGNNNQRTWNWTPVDFPMVAKFQSNFTWKPQIKEKTIEIDGDNSYPTYIAIGHYATSGTWPGLKLLGAFEFHAD